MFETHLRKQAMKAISIDIDGYYKALRWDMVFWHIGLDAPL
jgi:hypothetical protein